MDWTMTLERFLDDRALHCSPETVTHYRVTLGVFLRWLLANGSEVTSETVAGFLMYLRAQPIKNVSVRTYMRSLRVFCSWLSGQSIIERNFASGLKMPNDDSAPKIPLSASDVRRIDDTIDGSNITGLRNYCMIHFMLDCGLRLREVCSLTPSMINFERRYVVFMGKGYKMRVVPCPASLLSLVSRYQELRPGSREPDDPVFRTKGGEPVTKDSVECMIARLRKKSGVARLTPHLLRHTFATSYLCGGGNLEFLRILLGHSDISITTHYLHVMAVAMLLDDDLYELDPALFRFGYCGNAKNLL